MAETQTRPTPAPWIDVTAGEKMRDMYSQPIAITQLGKANLIAGVFGDVVGRSETAKANAALIVAACNACQLANPQNPQAVAGGLTALIEAANVAESFLRHMTPQAQGVAGQHAETLLRAALASIETTETSR